MLLFIGLAVFAAGLFILFSRRFWLMRFTLAPLALIAGALVLFVALYPHLAPARFTVNAPLLNALFGLGGGMAEANVFTARIKPPAGWQIKVHASGLAGARTMKMLPDGDMLVSQPRAGRVALVRADGSQSSLLTGLDRPYGLEIVWQKTGRESGFYLYVADAGRVVRYPFDPRTAQLGGAAEIILSGLPAGGNHWTRTIKQGQDGFLYLAIGSSCNVCRENDDRRAALLRLRPDGSDVEIFASGLRNTVGWDWHPETGQIYGVDNGRDLLGDNLPPEEVNLITRGGFYGWPHFWGDNVRDGDTSSAPPAPPIAPIHNLPPHSAPLALRFLRDAEPPTALVALHGSWNRTRKSGYKIVELVFANETNGGTNGEMTIRQRDWLTGFEENENVIGRPVDLAQDAKGAIYVSDDFAGAIYKLSRY